MSDKVTVADLSAYLTASKTLVSQLNTEAKDTTIPCWLNLIVTTANSYLKAVLKVLLVNYIISTPLESRAFDDEKLTVQKRELSEEVMQMFYIMRTFLFLIKTEASTNERIKEMTHRIDDKIANKINDEKNCRTISNLMICILINIKESPDEDCYTILVKYILRICTNKKIRAMLETMTDNKEISQEQLNDIFNLFVLQQLKFQPETYLKGQCDFSQGFSSFQANRMTYSVKQ